MRPSHRAILALAIVLPIALASIHSLCDLYFDCGCVPLWAGGAEHCNIHDPAPPNCPWCRGNTFIAVAAFIAAGVAAGAVTGARISSRISTPFLLAVAGLALSSWVASFF